MSRLSQKPKCPGSRSTSLLPSGADIVSLPGMSVWCHEATYAVQQTVPSLDHFVGAQYEASGDLVAYRLRRLEIDHQLEPGGLLDRNVGGLGAAEHLDQLARTLTTEVGKARAITSEGALFGIFRPLENAWQTQRRDALDECGTADGKHRGGQKIDRLGARHLNAVDGRQYVVASCDINDLERHSARTGAFLQYLQMRNDGVCVHQCRDSAHSGHSFDQDILAFA